MLKYVGSIDQFAGAPIKTIFLSGVIGSIKALKGAPIEYINVGFFDGSLEPLRGAPIKTLIMRDFSTGSLEPLVDSPLDYVELTNFFGAPVDADKNHPEYVDFKPLTKTPVRTLILGNFPEWGSIDSLKGAPNLKTLEIEEYNRPFKSLFKSFPSIKELVIQRCYEGSLNDLKGIKLEKLYIRFGDYDTSGSPDSLIGAPLKYLSLNGIKFNKSIEFIKSFPLLEYLELGLHSSYEFTKIDSIEPLRGLRLLKKLRLIDYNGSIEPLRGMPLESVSLRNFEGILDPLKGAPLKDLHVYGTLIIGKKEIRDFINNKLPYTTYYKYRENDQKNLWFH